MSINNFNNFNQPSLNGLVDINADSVSSTTITSDNIESDTINTDVIYVNGIDIAQQVISNAQKLTAITYSDTPTLITTIDSNLTVDGDVNIEEDINVDGLASFNNQFYIRAPPPENPNDIYMRIFYDTPSYGFRFALEKPGRYMYFSVKDPTGNYKTFQFNYTQMYSNIFFYMDNHLDLNYNMMLYFGVYGSNQGSSIRFVPSNQPHDGMIFTTYTPNNYNNFFLTDISGNLINTFRMHATQLTSFVNHQFNANILMNGNIIANSTTITPTELSYIDGVTSNIQTQLNLKAPLASPTFTGTINMNGPLYANVGLEVDGYSSFYFPIDLYDTLNFNASSKIVVNGGTQISQTELSYLDGVSSNLQTQLNLKAPLASPTFTGTSTFSGPVVTNNTIQMNGAINLNNDVTQLNYNINQYGSAKIFQNDSGSTSGVNTFKLTEFFDNISQTSTTSFKNKFTQSILSTDVSGNSNLLKYTNIQYNSNSASGTSSACLILQDNFNNNTLSMLPNSSSGAYNGIVPVNSCSIVANGTQNNNTILLTNWGNTMNGVRCTATNSTTSDVLIISGTNTITTHSINGVRLSGITQMTYSGGKVVDGNYGTIYQATLSNTAMTSGVEANCGSVSVPAGTYNITWNVAFNNNASATTIQAYSGCYSSASGSYSDSSAVTRSAIYVAMPIDQYFTTSGSTYVTFGSATTIYLRGNILFTTAGAVRIFAGLSSLRAIKVC